MEPTRGLGTLTVQSPAFRNPQSAIRNPQSAIPPRHVSFAAAAVDRRAGVCLRNAAHQAGLRSRRRGVAKCLCREHRRRPLLSAAAPAGRHDSRRAMVATGDRRSLFLPRAGADVRVVRQRRCVGGNADARPENPPRRRAGHPARWHRPALAIVGRRGARDRGRRFAEPPRRSVAAPSCRADDHDRRTRGARLRGLRCVAAKMDSRVGRRALSSPRHGRFGNFFAFAFAPRSVRSLPLRGAGCSEDLSSSPPNP